MFFFSPGILLFMIAFSLSYIVCQLVTLFSLFDSFTEESVKGFSRRIVVWSFVFGFSLFSYIHIT